MGMVGISHTKRRHTTWGFQRRTRALADALTRAIPANAHTVLDVGCGDGTIAHLVSRRRPDLFIAGVDVVTHPRTPFPVTLFDGAHLPFLDGGFDVVMFVDVLHRSRDPSILLREGKRVARGAVVLKDRTRGSLVADSMPRFLNWIANLPRRDRPPHHEWSSAQWRSAFERFGLSPETLERTLGPYRFPTSLLLERGLHFVARLAV